MPPRRWSRSSSSTRATSCSRSTPATLFVHRDGVSCGWASASARGCSCAATPSAASSPAWSTCRARTTTPTCARACRPCCAMPAGRTRPSSRCSSSDSPLARVLIVGAHGAARAPDRSIVRELEQRLVRIARSWEDDLLEPSPRPAAKSAATRCCERYADGFAAGYRDDHSPREAVSRHRADGVAERPRLAGDEPVAPPPRRRPGACASSSCARANWRRCRRACRCSSTWACGCSRSAPTKSDRAGRRHPTRTVDRRLRHAGARPRRGRRRGPARTLPRDRVAHLAWRQRQRRLQPPGAAGRPGLARRQRAAGLRALHEAGRFHVQPGLHRQALAAHPASRPTWWPCSTARFDPALAGDRAAASPRSRHAWPAALDEVGQPRRRPHPAPVPGVDPGHAAHQLLPAAEGGGFKPVHVVQVRPAKVPRPARAAARSRSSSIRRGSKACTCAAARSRAAGCAGRTAGGLPHRGAGPGQGAAGQERGHRAGRRPRAASCSKRAAGGRPRGRCPRKASPATRPSCGACSTSPTISGRGGMVAPPIDVVRHDGDDPYLVVAADKGTATFSDIANGIAAEYGFWLGDAFASGGSVGYDHKEHGHHRPRRLGSGQAPFPRAWPRHPDDSRSRSSVSATCRATCSATACCCRRARSSSSPPSTTAISSSIPIPTRRRASPSASACSSCRVRAGRTTTRR